MIETSSDKMLIEWSTPTSKERISLVHGTFFADFKARTLSIGGYYHPGSFSVVEDMAISESPSPRAPFSIGDVVKIDPSISLKELKIKQQKNQGEYFEGIGKVALNFY